MSRGWFARPALAVLLAACPAAGQDLMLTGARIVDVRSGTIGAETTILVRDGRIAGIGEAAGVGGRVLDVAGRFVVPGLIDAHAHIASLDAARRALESGVTTVRSSGVSSYVDVGMAELVRRGALAGPDVVPAGYHVRPRLAEAAFLGAPELADLMGGIGTAEEVRRVVRANLERGARFIKVLATERAGLPDTDPRRPVFDEGLLRAAVEEAGARRVPVQAHAHGDEGARAAVLAGVRSIEHGTYLSDETLRLMKERGTFYVPTYSIVLDLIEPGGDYAIPFLQLRGRHMRPALERAIRSAHRIGVKIVAGADTGYGPDSLARVSHELESFVALGMTPIEALRAATSTAAELLGREASLGAIAPGYDADLIVLPGDPLVSITAVQDVLLVISDGRVALDRLHY